MSVRPAGASDARLARSTAVAGEESVADSADSYGRLGDTFDSLEREFSRMDEQLSDLEQQFERLDDHLSQYGAE